MDEFEIGILIIYWMIALCFVAPPSAFVSAGVTVQNIFGVLLGSQDMNFVHYHIRRTSVTLIVHSFIPIGNIYTSCDKSY